ncbi:tetratricopeptide repeat protein [Sphingomonas sp. LY29]|uniref:tetratricopeptide repeat protein n=1 Tax=Sphingomonas sp. LY29 TaxID=3095341 RepID=UPI002D7793A0|nr:tetratricopeptide repeat protein [Sphingomonas sp. LY29]WRP25751.1 tetratricopeptide repeat protein [Sphingomonas sp. LY29]
MARAFLLAPLAVMLAVPPAAAQTPAKGEVNYPQGSLGYDALVSGNLEAAELQLRTSQIDRSDPARLINLGQVYAKTGRYAEAEKMFEAAMAAQDVELVLASGRVIGSRAAADKALTRMKAVVASR